MSDKHVNDKFTDLYLLHSCHNSTHLKKALELDVESVKSSTGTDGAISYNLRSTRLNRTLYVVTGNVTCKPPLTKAPNLFQVKSE